MDSLAGFIERAEGGSRSLVVLNRTRPRPVQNMLDDLFDDDSVAVGERQVGDDSADLVVAMEDGEVVASSSLAELEEALLFVNSDLFVTGARSLEDASVPDAIAALEETPFRVRDYPASDKEKLPLIAISRYIERLAWRHDGGRLRSSFQRLSRLTDEHGTQRVYDRLAETDVDVHVYGVPDWLPPESFEGVVHAGYGGEFRTSWFVVFHDDADDAPLAALVADEVSDGVWEAVWTFRPDRVRAVNRYVERQL